MKTRHTIPGDNNVLDVAAYIVKYCKINRLSITNLKLQKLLYFCQASYLLNTNGERACFNENIIAWPYGPVVIETYELYKHFGSSEINKIYVSSINSKKVINTEFFKEMLDVAARKNPFDLVELTHSQSPWKDAYKRGSGTVISKNSIVSYFNK